MPAYPRAELHERRHRCVGENDAAGRTAGRPESLSGTHLWTKKPSPSSAGTMRFAPAEIGCPPLKVQRPLGHTVDWNTANVQASTCRGRLDRRTLHAAQGARGRWRAAVGAAAAQP